MRKPAVKNTRQIGIDQLAAKKNWAQFRQSPMLESFLKLSFNNNKRASPLQACKASLGFHLQSVKFRVPTGPQIAHTVPVGTLFKFLNVLFKC